MVGGRRAHDKHCEHGRGAPRSCATYCEPDAARGASRGARRVRVHNVCLERQSADHTPYIHVFVSGLRRGEKCVTMDVDDDFRLLLVVALSLALRSLLAFDIVCHRHGKQRTASISFSSISF